MDEPEEFSEPLQPITEPPPTMRATDGIVAELKALNGLFMEVRDEMRKLALAMNKRDLTLQRVSNRTLKDAARIGKTEMRLDKVESRLKLVEPATNGAAE